MAEDTIVKHAYHGRTANFTTGNTYTIVLHKPHNVEILSANTSGITDKNLNVFVKSDDENARLIYKEEDIEITPVTPLPRNQKFTIVIPQTDQPIFNLFPEGHASNQPFQIPLESFINNKNTDPIKILLFNFNRSSGLPRPVFNMTGDTSYLNGISFTPITDDDSTMLFAQEMSSPLNIPDGPVNIDKLSQQDTQAIVKEILGHDYEDHLDKDKVENLYFNPVGW